MATIPADYDPNDIETKWRTKWLEANIYGWDKGAPRERTFVVDTPPPTVSGSLHIGHCFSYTQTDVIVRYKRMKGFSIFYPMGWDDNGLPTERRVQNLLGIQCDAALPYDAAFKPAKTEEKKDAVRVSRKNFIEACAQVTHDDERVFQNLWQRLGLSVDWSEEYSTISEHARRVSQFSFLDLVKKGFAYNAESITMWDTTFQTAIAQAEVEDRATNGAFHDMRFTVQDGGEFIIATTRPELLAACIAVAAHPSDERYKKYFGKTAITPLFAAPVPIVESEHADPEKGSGILMICTFGDIADVDWWKRSGLPARQIIGRDGKLMRITFGDTVFASTDVSKAQSNYDQIAGLYTKQARKKTVELLKAEGSLIGEPKPLSHPVRYYEKGDLPLEYIPTRQWFIKILDHKEALLAQGKKIAWHPDYMHTRYEHWVRGLNQDWCVSRQRYFGVPFPVWYRLDANKNPDYAKPIFADMAKLPIDPLTDTPPGFNESQRNAPNGFTADADVMDTWATSSLTPQLSSRFGITGHERPLFPADMRPQSHEIIRTWAFYTIAKAWMHENKIPWSTVAVSGWILDPDRKKMSKSKGNVITPEGLIDQHSADVIRYWAGKAKLGVDTAFDDTLFKIGRRLTVKLFNAGKFVLANIGTASYGIDEVSTEIDRAWLASLRNAVAEANASFERYDCTAALLTAETIFWDFCDNYLELAKGPAYSADDTPVKRSAIAPLRISLSIMLRLFAPFLPYITEEIWSWALNFSSGSIHTAPWPSVDEISTAPQHASSYAAASEVLSKIRGEKTTQKKSLKYPVASLSVTGTKESLDVFRSVSDAVFLAGTVDANVVTYAEGTPSDGGLFSVRVVLADQPA